MKNKVSIYISIFILVIFFFPNFSLAQEKCSQEGYTIATINGMFTDDERAKGNMVALATTFGFFYNRQNIDYQYFLNPSHIAGLGDFFAVAYQKLFDTETVKDYDLVEMLSEASHKVVTQKLLLIGHSQGNFYANSLYDVVADQPGGVPERSIGGYGVASPASRVAGYGKYLTSSTDSVIENLRWRGILFIMEANDAIKLPENNTSNGHSFSDVYLKYRGDKIISDIQTTLAKLKENDEQLPEDPCISPPELSTIHKVQGVILAVADPAAIVVKTGLVVTYKTGVAIRDKTTQVADAIAQSIFKNNFGVDNRAAVGAADGEEGQGETDDSSSESESAPENSKPTAQIPKSENIASNEVSPSSGSPSTVVNTEEVLQSPAPTVTNHRSGGGGGGASTPEAETTLDTTAPIISILGNASVTINVGISYADEGATALDDINGDITANIVIVNPVDANVVADYTITYNVLDAAGNSATEVTRSVHVVAVTPPPVTDTTAPVITVLGDNPVTIETGNSYVDAGATATDDVDGQIVVNTSSSVDTDTVGTYTITYTATDAAGNTATGTRIVNVEALSSLALFDSRDTFSDNLPPFQSGGNGGILWQREAGGAPFDGIIKAINMILVTSPAFNRSGTFYFQCWIDDGIDHAGSTQVMRAASQVFNTGDYLINSAIFNFTPYEIDTWSYADLTFSNPFGDDCTFNAGETVRVAVTDSVLYIGDYNSGNLPQHRMAVSDSPDFFSAVAHSSMKTITSFDFPGLSPEVVGVINETDHTISLSVPFDTDVTTLAPTIIISSFAIISPNNNEAQNFTNPVTYTVTAENGSTQNYIATVTITPDSGPTLISAEVTSETTVDLTFSEDLDGRTVTNADFSVTAHTLSSTDAFEITPGVVRLTISDTFASGETPEIIYNTTVSNGVKDLNGNVVPEATITATTTI